LGTNCLKKQLTSIMLTAPAVPLLWNKKTLISIVPTTAVYDLLSIVLHDWWSFTSPDGHIK
jgi:hypothetical protein